MPATPATDYEKIRQFLVKVSARQGHGSRVDIQSDTPLFREGIMDSFGVMELAAFLEEAFGIEINKRDVSVENFKNISRILSFVKSKKP